MSSLDNSLIQLGTRAATNIFRYWLHGRSTRIPTGEPLAALLARRCPELLRQRRARRQFEQVADLIVGRLQSFLDTEFRYLPQEHLVSPVNLALDILTLVESGEVVPLGPDLNAITVERNLRSVGAHLVDRGQVGWQESEAGVFIALLREVSAHMVEVYTALPDLTTKTLDELLRKETAIPAMAETALAHLPAATRSAGAESPDQVAFETEYRRSLARRFDQLELFGATLSQFSRRYALTVAYVSLSVTRHAASEHDEADEPRRVEQVLGRNADRVLIRGEAGSGKTTLLRWLAVFAARRELTGRLEPWNHRIPIYLPLRRYAGVSLPAPEQFLGEVLPSLVETMPARWAHQVLRGGRALLLLDGADELSAEQRREFETWLDEVLRSFPDNVAVVTSRPVAVDGSWLRGLRFESYDLQPMTLQDTKSLVDHWHAAVGTDVEDPEELRTLGAYRENLKSIIEERRPIRTLATNPLICALICALHRDRRTQLPRNRMEIYRIALEMLLDRRDKERKVEAFARLELTYREKELILEDLAYWLIRNGQTVAPVRTVTTRIGKKLAQIPGVKNDRKTVLTHLLERSGVLRSPTEGEIDFLHRSFQEYLGAKACIAADDIPLLARHALDDQWRDMIIMAAGHARAAERETLISQILDMGDADTDNRHRLYLLAVSCLETSTELSAKITDRLQAALAEVVPPKDATDAAAIASAGELAVSFLSGHGEQPAEVVAACVRALALIGGLDAMTTLRQYAADRRSEVAQEIARAWTSFPAQPFARRVLGPTPLDRGAISLPDAGYVDFLPELRHLRRVRADGLNVEQLHRLADITKARHLELAAIRAGDFSWLDGSRVETLRITASNLYSWEGIERAAHLTRISLHRCAGLSSNGVLADLPRLEALHLEAVGVASLRFLGRGLPLLRRLTVIECGFLSSLHGIEALTGLEELTLEDNPALTDLSPLKRLTKLRKVNLQGGYLEDLSPLAGIPDLQVSRSDTRLSGFRSSKRIG